MGSAIEQEVTQRREKGTGTGDRNHGWTPNVRVPNRMGTNENPHGNILRSSCGRGFPPAQEFVSISLSLHTWQMTLDKDHKVGEVRTPQEFMLLPWLCIVNQGERIKPRVRHPFQAVLILVTVHPHSHRALDFYIVHPHPHSLTQGWNGAWGGGGGLWHLTLWNAIMECWSF